MTRFTYFKIIDKGLSNSWISNCYDVLMFITIIVSIIPLMFRNSNSLFLYVEWYSTGIFVIDYFLRWSTADYKLNKGKLSFILYPFSIMAIIDLLSILPTVSALNPALKILRLTRFLKVLRLLRIWRYSRKMMIFVRVLQKEKKVLISVLLVAILYIIITALIMFNVEPEVNPETERQTFSSFFDALYWATISLTTGGYGDFSPVTEIGRLISIISALFGVAIIALPSSVITASYIDMLREEEKIKTTITSNNNGR